MKQLYSSLLVGCSILCHVSLKADAFHQSVSLPRRTPKQESILLESRRRNAGFRYSHRISSIDRLKSAETDSTDSLSLSLDQSIITNHTTIITNDEEPRNSYPPTPTFLECMKFALPALGIYICSPLMSLIDASFIGRLSTSVELAALGPASAISDSAAAPLLFLSIATTNLIAKSFAKKDQETSTTVTRTALGMGSILGTILAISLYAFAGPLSRVYCGQQQVALASACTEYVAIRAIALPAVVITTIAQAVCIGTKDTKTPMVAVALAGVCNLLGDFILVKGLKQGIAGAAWATSASQFLAAGLLLRTLAKRGILNSKKKSSTSKTISTMKQLLSFIPFLFILCVKIGWHNSCTATAASLGSISAAAHTGLASVVGVCMVLGDVGSSLSQAFLPAFENSNSNTENDKDSNASATKSPASTFDTDAAMPTILQLLKCTLSISAAVTTFAALAVGVFGSQITSDPLVVAKMKETLPWIMATLCFHGSAVTLEGLLLSAKNFRPLTMFYSFLAVTVVGFQVATRRLGLGLAGVWGCYAWFCSARVLAFSIFGGLLRPRRWWQNFISKREKLGAKPSDAIA